MSDASQAASHEFAAQYAAALEGYLAGAGETALSSAYELGRQALEYEAGMLVVADAHHQALKALLHKKNSTKASQILAEAADFFTECISSFEMAQRGFRESVGLLRNMNEMLRGQQRDLSLLLSPMPNLLLTLDENDRLAAFFVPPGFPRILKACEIGLSLAEVLPDVMGTNFSEALEEVHESGQVYRLEFPFIVDGATLYFDLQISPVPESRDVLLVIDNITARKEIEIAEHNQRILAEALRDTALTLNSSLDLDEILRRIFASIGQVVPHDTATIILIDKKVARIVRSYGYVEHGLEQITRTNPNFQISPEKTPKMYEVVETKRPVIIDDLAANNARYGYSGLGISGSAVSAPIFIADLVIGLINLNSFEVNFYTPTHAENLQIFANQAAIAIQNARLYEHAQELAAFNERQRLARDLHDSVSQSLFAASSMAESATKLWERNPKRVLTLLLDLHQLLRSSMAEMRILLWELRPANLIATPLDKLITQLVDAYRSRTHMTIICSAAETQNLPEDVHIALYRITQESLNNIVKHSRATEAGVDLRHEDEKIVLHIYDNGKGFDMGEISSGFGLDNMRERAEMIGAALDVMSEQARGTRITIKWAAATVSQEDSRSA